MLSGAYPSQLEVFLLTSGWDASPWQGNPPRTLILLSCVEKGTGGGGGGGGEEGLPKNTRQSDFETIG